MHKTILNEKFSFYRGRFLQKFSEPLWFYQKMKVDIRSEFGTKTGPPESYQTGNASSVFITVSVYI